MKNLFALLFVAGTLSMVSCGEKKEEASTDSVADSAAVIVDESATVVEDTTMMVDTIKVVEPAH